MKFSIKYIAAALLTAGALSSCDSMLDKYPLDSLSPDTFFSNASELQAFTNTFYTMLPGTGAFDEKADHIIAQDLISEMRGGRTIAASGGGWSWGDLRKINTMLEYSVNCEDEAVRTQYCALARFFRAYFYFDKVKRFGDVPWYDKQLGSGDAELYKPRDSRELVMQNIIADLDYAIANLPTTKSVYTITKWTALAYKSRICLFEGTFRKYHAGNPATLGTLSADAQPYTYYLQQAADAADEFISTSGYTIYTKDGVSKDYLGLFTTPQATELMSEVVLARDYNANYSVTHNSNSYLMAAGQGRPGFTKKLVASYLMKDGSRYTDKAGWEKNQFVEEMKNRDPRLAQSIRNASYRRYKDGTPLSPDLTLSVTGYAPVKYLMDSSQDGYSVSDVDLILMRAAEVYLNYAEAKAELGTLTQADLDKTIKPIRARVGMPALDMKAANANPDPYLCGEWGYKNVSGEFKGVILEIRRERAIELVQEGHRYYDVIRWAEGHTFETPLQGLYFPGEGTYDIDGDGQNDVTLYKDTKPAGAASLALKIGVDIVLSDGDSGSLEPHKNARSGWKWDDGKDYYYPIPTDDRSLTNGALTQNPGWDDGLIFGE
jgi:hypothetical protein